MSLISGLLAAAAFKIQVLLSFLGLGAASVAVQTAVLSAIALLAVGLGVLVGIGLYKAYRKNKTDFDVGESSENEAERLDQPHDPLEPQLNNQDNFPPILDSWEAYIPRTPVTIEEVNALGRVAQKTSKEAWNKDKSAGPGANLSVSIANRQVTCMQHLGALIAYREQNPGQPSTDSDRKRLETIFNKASRLRDEQDKQAAAKISVQGQEASIQNSNQPATQAQRKPKATGDLIEDLNMKQIVPEVDLLQARYLEFKQNFTNYLTSNPNQETATEYKKLRYKMLNAQYACVYVYLEYMKDQNRIYRDAKKVKESVPAVVQLAAQELIPQINTLARELGLHAPTASSLASLQTSEGSLSRYSLDWMFSSFYQADAQDSDNDNDSGLAKKLR